MNTNPFQSAFGSQGSSGSAFTATTNHVNTNSSNPSGVSGNSAFRITSAFGSNQNGGGFSDGGRYSANENRQNNSSYNQAATFDRSGNLMANTHSTRGSGGGRGSNSYRGSGFGGNSGRGASTSHRGSANKTYVAPGLSTGHQQLQQHGLSAGSGNTNATGSSFTSPSAGAKTGRGRGGYQSRGGRGGARGRGVTGGMPGQYRSLQWRADQNTSQEADSTMSVDSSMGVTTAGGFKSGPNASSQVRGQQQQHSSSMSAFGAQRQNENSDFNQTGPAFPGGQSSQGQWFSQVGTTGYQPNGSFQNTFVGGTSTVPHRSAFIAAPSDTSNQRSSSAFGLGGPGGNSNSGNQDSVFAIPASQGPVFAAQQKSLPSNSFTKGPASSKQEPGSTEDADESRLARFTAVPIGNRFEEFKEKRVKEREDAIRRGAIPDPDKPRRLEDAITFVGTCRDMCPEFERHEREYQQNVEKFEKIPGTESIDHSRAVKAYARPAAGVEQPLPSDVRPPDVLLSTLDYLMREIVARGDLADSHAFVRDRTRSIRQDFTLQNNRGIEAVQAHEIIARYHIMCMHQLCENKNFSEQQEMEQLRKVLTSLTEFYDDMCTEGIVCPNEAEFRAYHILSHLRDPDMIRQAQLLPLHVFRDSYIQTAAEVHALTRRNNDVRRRAKIQSEASQNFFSLFFNMVQGPRISYLMACLLETNFVEIRKGALKALNKCYLEQHDGFSVEYLVNILGFDDMEECIANCEEYGLAITRYGQPAVVFGRKDPTTRRRIFKEGTISIKQHRNERIVEAKRRNYTTIQIVYGETPGPHQEHIPGAMGRPPSVAPSTYSRPSQGLVSSIATSRLGFPAAAAGAPTFASVVAKPVASAATPKPTTVFNFGVSSPSIAVVGTSPASTGPNFSLSTGRSGLDTNSSFQAPTSSIRQISTQLPTVPSSASGPSTAFASLGGISISKPPSSTGLAPLTLNSAAPSFKPASQQPEFSFTAPTVIPTSGFNYNVGTAENATASPFAFTGTNQAPAASYTSAAPSSSQSTSNTFIMPTVPLAAAGALATPAAVGALFNRPPSLPLPATTPVAPKSDSMKIVTKRGRIYPRQLVESVMLEFLERETDRLIRATAAQMSQEVAVERSIRRAKQRQEVIQQELASILSDVAWQLTKDVAKEVLADLRRERTLGRRVITQWKDFTAKRRQRAEELRRRQEHFLMNVRAMGSRAGLVDSNPMAAKISEYNALQQLQQYPLQKDEGSADGSIKAMIAAVSNKRKRLLSIGQEGSPDLALVAGLKKVMAPKRELWAPLPVWKIVDSCYQSSGRQQQKQQLDTSTQGPALMKRRWRLFVNTPSFKGKSSKWLLTKLGIDMGRHTRAQQRSGIMVAVHQSLSTEENAVDVVVHGSEDQSVESLLGMSKYSIMEAGAFIFEFSKITLADHAATNDAIRRYWDREHDRLVRFLACFPKVKQPIVFIVWTDASEIWERISPRMVEYLQLDQMVESPQGPLLGYRFLNLNMANMKLDPYIVGSLEWLASETREFIEDPSVVLKRLLEMYRTNYEWMLSRMTLVDAPLYSQLDEDDEEAAHLWRLKSKQDKQRRENGLTEDVRGSTEPQRQQARGMFVEIFESGFSLAIKMFNMELDSIAETIETKGQGETREGAEQEGKVKDAMARFIRQAELPAMKIGAIQERINYGMDPKSAICDFIDVYVASLGGVAKERSNLQAKVAMRKEIWEMLTSSKDDLVPLEKVFLIITRQILEWVEAGILDTERFSIRIRKWEQQRHDLRLQQGHYQRQHQDQCDQESDVQDPSSAQLTSTMEQQEQVFTPMLIHDEVDVPGNAYQYDLAIREMALPWEKMVENLVYERELRASAVPQGSSSVGDNLHTRAGLNGPIVIGDGRKRRAPERPRIAMKKSKVERAVRNDLVESDDLLYLAQAPSPRDATSTTSSAPPVTGTVKAHLATHESFPAITNGNAAQFMFGTGVGSSFSWNGTLPGALGTTATVSATSQTPSLLPRSSIASQPLVSTPFTTILSRGTSSSPALSSTTAAGSTGDRLARLRNLIKEVKTTTLQQ